MVAPAAIEFTMGDGTVVDLALNFRGMSIFEEKARALGTISKESKDWQNIYKAVNKLVLGPIDSIMDYANGLYGCYVIALFNANSRLRLKDIPISLDEWYEKLGDDFTTIYQAARTLSDPKYRTLSQGVFEPKSGAGAEEA